MTCKRNSSPKSTSSKDKRDFINLDLLTNPRKNKKYSPKGALIRPKIKNHLKQTQVNLSLSAAEACKVGPPGSPKSFSKQIFTSQDVLASARQKLFNLTLKYVLLGLAGEMRKFLSTTRTTPYPSGKPL